jgi:hypothetical protein
MGRTGKTSAIILIGLMAITSASLLMDKSVNADLTIKPWDYVYKTPPVVTVNLLSNNSILYSNSYVLNFTINQPTGQWLIQSVNDEVVTKQMFTGYGIILDGRVYDSFQASSDFVFSNKLPR